MTASLKIRPPLPFEPNVYRELYRDLRSMTEAELKRHYDRWGLHEGRRSHALASRSDFAALAGEVDVLEIGPFDSPLLRGPRVRYFDVLDRAGLIERASRLGRRGSGVPEQIHYVSGTGDLSIVDGTFDAVLSSHVVEHQPDLVRHLRAVTRCLRPGGAYLLLVPDKRYCFDHFLPTSTIADVLEAHHAQRVVHSLKSQIEHAALTTHNNAQKHWKGEHGKPPRLLESTRETVARYRSEPAAYVDVHSWCFTPESFGELMRLLRELSYIELKVAAIYPTLEDTNEFWAILEAGPRAAD